MSWRMFALGAPPVPFALTNERVLPNVLLGVSLGVPMGPGGRENTYGVHLPDPWPP